MKRTICKMCVVSFLSLNPLVGCVNDIQNEKSNKNGVIMTQETKIQSSFEQLKEAQDKRKFMESFAKQNTFTECKSLLTNMLSDKTINVMDKWRALDGTGSKYRKEVLDFAFDSIKNSSEKFDKLNQNEKDNLSVYSSMLSFSSEYLRKYAAYVSESTSFVDVVKGESHPLGIYFKDALITRASLSNVDETLNLSKEFMNNTYKYSLYVTILSAVAIVKIDYSKGMKIIKEEIKSTLNPLKKKVLEGVVEQMLEEQKKTQDILGVLDKRTLGSTPRTKGA